MIYFDFTELPAKDKKGNKYPKVVDFIEELAGGVVLHPQTGQPVAMPPKQVRQRWAIMEAMQEIDDDAKKFCLEDAHAQELKRCVNEPRWNRVNAWLVKFIDVIDDAVDNKRKKPQKKATDKK